MQTGLVTRNNEAHGAPSATPAEAPPALALASAGARVLCLLLLLFQLLTWVMGVASRGGLDTHARLIDFTATLTGARIIRDGDGARLYDLAVQQAAQERVLAPAVTLKAGTILPYIHPPFEALAFAPLIDLPYGALYLLWTVAVLLAIGGALLLLARAVPLRGTGRWLLLAAIGSFGALHQALALGQSSPFVFLGLCGTYAALKGRRDGWAGVGLALMVLKPQMLLLVGLLLLLERRWKSLAIGGGFIAGGSVVAMAFLGPLWPLHYARFLSGIAGWAGNHNEYPSIMHNWRGLAFHFIGEGAPGLAATVVALLTLASLGLFARAWWLTRAGRTPGTWDGRVELLWAMVGPVAVLISPHLYIHDLTLLIFSAWLIAGFIQAGAWSRGTTRLWLTLLWGGYLGAFVFAFRSERFLAFPTVPNTLLIVAAMLLLAWHLRNLAGRAHPTGSAGQG